MAWKLCINLYSRILIGTTLEKTEQQQKPLIKTIKELRYESHDTTPETKAQTAIVSQT